MSTRLGALIIDEKGGHKLRRKIDELFMPWCGICKRDVCHDDCDDPMWRETEPLARDVLNEHCERHHASER